MWSGALDSSALLLSYLIASLALTITNILIFTLKYPYIYIFIHIQWVGTVPKARNNSLFAISTDLPPTFLAAAGVPVPSSMRLDGMSILSELTHHEHEHAENDTANTDTGGGKSKNKSKSKL